MSVTCADVLAVRGRKTQKSDSASVVCNANVETDLFSHPMNRSDIVELLAERFSQLTQHDVDSAVTTILDAMNGALVQGHRIELRGFGSFSVIYRAPRLGRNPRSGAPVEIPEKRVPHFKPGKALRENVDRRTEVQ